MIMTDSMSVLNDFMNRELSYLKLILIIACTIVTVDLCEIYIYHTCINHIIQGVSRASVVIMATVYQWDHLILPVSVKLATLDLPVRLTSMTVCQ